MLFAVTNAACLSPQLAIIVNTISMMIRYSSISTKAFLNLPKLKFLQRAILTPSALIPQKQLNANVSTNAKTKPFVGMSQPKAYDKHEVATNRMFSIVSRIFPYLLLLAFILSESFSVISCSAYLPIHSDISFISNFVNIGIIIIFIDYSCFVCHSWIVYLNVTLYAFG